MDNQTQDPVACILGIVTEIRDIVCTLKERRSELEGEPILEFSEVCQLLRQSERQVRRYREQKRLVGFNIGRRRMYLMSEVREFIRTMHKQGLLPELKDNNSL